MKSGANPEEIETQFPTLVEKIGRGCKMLSTIYEALQWAQQSHLIFTTLKLTVFSLIDGEIKTERFSNVPKIS